MQLGLLDLAKIAGVLFAPPRQRHANEHGGLIGALHLESEPLAREAHLVVVVGKRLNDVRFVPWGHDPDKSPALVGVAFVFIELNEKMCVRVQDIAIQHELRSEM